MRFLRPATFDSVFSSVFFWPRQISIFMCHLLLRCKVSGTDAPRLPSTTVILTVFKDRAVLQDIPRRNNIFSKVPEGHHPRGTTLREALRGNLPLRGLCGGLSEGSAGSLRGFCGVSAGFCGGPRDFPEVFRG